MHGRLLLQEIWTDRTCLPNLLCPFILQSYLSALCVTLFHIKCFTNLHGVGEWHLNKCHFFLGSEPDFLLHALMLHISGNLLCSNARRSFCCFKWLQQCNTDGYGCTPCRTIFNAGMKTLFGDLSKQRGNALNDKFRLLKSCPSKKEVNKPTVSYWQEKCCF